MVSYIEYLNVPSKIAIAIVALFLVTQVVGEVLEFCGIVVPEFVKIRKKIIRARKDKEILRNVPVMVGGIQEKLDEFMQYYKPELIAKRNEWMDFVNKTIKDNKDGIRNLSEKLEKNNKDTLDLLVDMKRNAIINFASVAIDKERPVTREQFHRIFKIYEEYEHIIEENGLTNGEVDIAYKIINKAYELHMLEHSFVEDNFM